MTTPANIITKKFNFLHGHIAKEPHIYEVLKDIYIYQNRVIKTGEGSLATLEIMKQSKNIRMPHSPSRNKNIVYLVELLHDTYPEEIKTIVTFNFKFDKNTKRLAIDEQIEYTVLITNEDFNRIQNDRDNNSVDNVLLLLSKFALFNLTALIKITKNKTDLSRVIKTEIKKNIFVFKRYSFDRNQLEMSEDFCFYIKNYNAVRNKLDSTELKKIISTFSVPISKRLKNFGILNSDFGDYRDPKLDYLSNILLDDLSSLIDKKDLIEVKNYNSLRTCLLKSDKIVDPLITLGKDIVKHVKENGICKGADLIAVFESLTEDLLMKWSGDNLDKERIFTYNDKDNNNLYIDGDAYLTKISNLHKLILNQQEKFLNLAQTERQENLSLMKMLCNAGKNLIPSSERSISILRNEKNINFIKQIINEFDEYEKKIITQKIIDKEKHPAYEKKSFTETIVGFFKALFNKKKKEVEVRKTRESNHDNPKVSFSKATGDIYNEIKSKKAPVIPLSDFFEIVPENEIQLDVIINELRGNKQKIVVPVYNARKILYPRKSEQYLIADTEYLLIEPDVIQTTDSIREFTDSLAGNKIKGESISGSAIAAIEKYLLTIHRQKRMKLLKK